jgi:16S rRNA (guanine966-N2)-methyltransferase
MPYTRPTTDLAKEGLFNILENNLDLSARSEPSTFSAGPAVSAMSWPAAACGI